MWQLTVIGENKITGLEGLEKVSHWLRSALAKNSLLLPKLMYSYLQRSLLDKSK